MWKKDLNTFVTCFLPRGPTQVRPFNESSAIALRWLSTLAKQIFFIPASATNHARKIKCGSLIKDTKNSITAELPKHVEKNCLIPSKQQTTGTNPLNLIYRRITC